MSTQEDREWDAHNDRIADDQARPLSDDELRAADYAEAQAEARRDEPGDDHAAADRYEAGIERGWGDAR